MHPRIVVMLCLGFCGGLALAACGPTTPACSAATCGGCCDQTGKCQAGNAADACGVNGASCGRCGAGTMCQVGECRAANSGGGSGGGTGGGTTGGGGGGGTGGGATGGGAGGGATGGGSGGGTTGGGSGGGTMGGGAGGGTGGGGGCRMISTLATTQTNLGLAEYRSFMNSPGHYNLAIWSYLGATPEGFRVEVVYPNDVRPNFPYTENFTAGTRYNNCTACGIYYEDCDMNLVCQRTYLAQGGSMLITRADPASAGRLIGSATNLRFNQWDLAGDVAEGNGCIIVTNAGPWDIGWNADGGAIPP